MNDINNLIINGKYDGLVIILEEKLSKSDYTYVNHLIQGYINIGCIDKAVKLYSSVAQILGDDSSHWVLMELGRALIKRKKFSELQEILNFFVKSENVMIKVVSKSLKLEINTVNNEFVKGAKYVEITSIWSHLFNNSACHILKNIENKLNIKHTKAINRYEDNNFSLIGISIDSLAYYGRFGHQMSEYLLVRTLSDKYNIPLETPEWVGDYVFELNDCENKYPRTTVKYDAAKIIEIADKSFGLELIGKDFFSPGYPLKWDKELNKKIKNIFVFRQHLKNMLDLLIKKLQNEKEYIIAFHLRLGDRTETLSETNSIDCYLHWLEKNWESYPNACLYIASDNVEYAKEKFQKYNAKCITDFEIECPELDWLYDFYVLCNANIVGISHSGFSIMASTINNVVGSKFYQPNSLIKDLVPFYPDNFDLTNYAPGTTIVL